LIGGKLLVIYEMIPTLVLEWRGCVRLKQVLADHVITLTASAAAALAVQTAKTVNCHRDQASA